MATIGDPSASTSSADCGLLAWLDETRVPLPLKRMDCRFEVCGEVLSVFIEQVFHNDNWRAISCLYSFPLPGDAAVYLCELQVGDRVISAHSEERKKARELYREKLLAGYRAGLVEMERGNLFTLSLGNVQQQETIVVRFGYFQTLERTGKELSLRIPFCPGEKYIPGNPLLRSSVGHGTVADTDHVPDASRVSPPRISPTHPDAAPLSIQGSFSGARILPGTLRSPLHRIKVQHHEQDTLVSLAPAVAVPDRDFVLRWYEVEDNKTAVDAWVDRSGTDTYALVRIKAPERVPALKHEGMDHYFLLDRSTSMEGEKWQKTAEALIQFALLLEPHDRVWITFFESEHYDYSDTLMRPEELLQDPAFLNIASIGTTGGTEMLPALQHVLRATESGSPGRPADVILITDGQVGDEREILEELKHYPGLKVHVFGIDTAVNDAFLRRMAQQQNGRAVFQTPADDITHAISSLAVKLNRPVVTNLHISKEWEAGFPSLPDLYQDDTLVVPLRGRDIDCLNLSGLLADGSPWKAELTAHAVGSPALRLLWAKQRIEWHDHQSNQDESVRLSKEFNLVSQTCAFVAWDGSENVKVAEGNFYMPSMTPLQLADLDAGDDVSKCCYSMASIAPGDDDEDPDVVKPRRTAGEGGFISRFRSLLGGLHEPEKQLARELKPLEKHPLFNSFEGQQVLLAINIWWEQTPMGVIRFAALLHWLVKELLAHEDDREFCLKLCREFAGHPVVSLSTRQKLIEAINVLDES